MAKKEETFAQKITRENREKFAEAAKLRKEAAKKTAPKKDEEKVEKKDVKTPEKKDVKVVEPTLLPNGIVIPIDYEELKTLAKEKGYDSKVGIGKLKGLGKETLIAYLTAWKPAEAPKKDEEKVEKKDVKTPEKKDVKVVEPTLLPNGIVIPIDYEELKTLAKEKGYDSKVGIGKLKGLGKETLIAYLTAWKPAEAPKKDEEKA